MAMPFLAQKVLQNLHFPFCCRWCGKVCSSMISLKQHERVHTGERPFKCSQCEKTFAQTSNLKKHFGRVHSGERPFVCQFCDKAFSVNVDLERHMRTRNCPKLKLNPNLTEHSQEGKDNKSKTVNVNGIFPRGTGQKDEDCGHPVQESDQQVQEYSFHTLYFSKLYLMRKIHFHTKCTKERSLILRDTGQFPLQRPMQTKSWKDLPARKFQPYVCKICGVTLRASHGLKMHMRRHTGEKPYVCPQCDRAFPHKNSLQRHVRLHGQTPYKCPTCGMGFIQAISLRQHQIDQHRGIFDPTDLNL
ncbi:zinc finger protein 420-like [Lineus longissimus]|uniref:zinc finger protein 420-like n=1 Tax=Lineus longissimus TaxID=88925 RepID=UPI00315CA0A4